MPGTKPTILVIMGVYLPGFGPGGPLRTLVNMVEWMSDDFFFKILTSDRDFGDSAPYPHIQAGAWQPVGKASVFYLSPKEQSLWEMRRVISQTPHDMLYVDGVFATFGIKTLLLYRTNLIPHKPLVIAPRGHLMAGALRMKSTKKRLFLTAAKLIGLYRNLNWHASNPGEMDEIVREFGPNSRARIRSISNLPAPALYRQHRGLLAKHEGSARLIFLSRISRKKNLHFALELLQNVPGQIQFDIYGPIEDHPYWQECLSLISKLPANVTVQYRGVAPFDRASQIYADYHLLFLPTLGENFGHAILESLCAGCPVLISDRTPWNDLSDQGAGWSFPLSEPARFREALGEVLHMDARAFSETAERAQKYGNRYLSETHLVEKTRQFFNEVIGV